eukprot:1205194-Amphidinium_carterae.1
MGQARTLAFRMRSGCDTSGPRVSASHAKSIQLTLTLAVGYFKIEDLNEIEMRTLFHKNALARSGRPYRARPDRLWNVRHTPGSPHRIRRGDDLETGGPHMYRR